MSAQIRETREIVREEPFMRSRILDVLMGGPLTVPEIAAVIDRPTHETLYWVMGMRRYGFVRETKEVTAEGYFRYQAVRKETRA
jgi:hypothetical protein